MTASVLHLRGALTPQPATDAATGNTLCWNGEAYEGVENLGIAENDTAAVRPRAPACVALCVPPDKRASVPRRLSLSLPRKKTKKKTVAPVPADSSRCWPL